MASMFSRRRRGFGLLKRAGPILLAGVAACSSQPSAPTGAGLCWRMVEVADRQPEFRIIARDVPNLESCAAQLEGARMMEGRPTTGAYNGHFIFATEEQITSAVTMNGTRVRIFEAEDRRKVQDGLRALIDSRRSQEPPEN
ncbi:MAG: hypothetical protein KL785_08310 [Brevundimonas sp.]|nr:hypothetical protein [Brevundimonas sp.]